MITDEALERRLKEHGSDVIEKDNPRQLRQFRNKVLGRVSSFYNDDRDIKLAIHESLGGISEDHTLSGWVPGDQVVNVVPIQEENKLLKEELQKLKAEKNRKTGIFLAKNDDDFTMLKNVLGEVMVKFPENISGPDREANVPLLQVLIASKEKLVTGVTNSPNAGMTERFLYYSVVPKLQIHSLAENEKVSGVRWRRGFLSKEGLNLLAWLEREEMAKLNKSDEEHT